jgi:hypothetical protein
MWNLLKPVEIEPEKRWLQQLVVARKKTGKKGLQFKVSPYNEVNEIGAERKLIL